MRALVWFRVDLRARDNPALHEACARADRGVVGVFLLTPAMWREHHDSPNKIAFHLACLRELSKSLAERNIALLVREAPGASDAPAALLRLARSCRCDALFFNDQLELNERSRDEAVEEAFLDAGLQVFRRHDQTAPLSLRTCAGGAYKVFSPFYLAWRRALAERPEALAPLGLPRRQSELFCPPDPVPVSLKGFEATADLSWLRPGENAAAKRLRRFLDGAAKRYHQQRDAPACRGTSELSPYFTAGALSLRQALSAAVEANNGAVEGGNPGLSQWIRQLAWRDFHRFLLAATPRLSMGRPMKLWTEMVPWRRDQRDLQAWRQGETGYPLVDAAMQQLRATGWMHNRLRMITAMFLSKHLLLDWRLGERWFMEQLVDGDLANNNGGWQWSASTGADAAPYFRVMNPTAQSRRWDPQGRFIRAFLPRLADIDDQAVHDPPASLRQSLGYPPPIVDHAKARSRAIAAFRRARPA